MAAITTIITGATSGIGKETALALAKKGHALYLLVRDVVKGDELVRQLKQQTVNKEIFSVKCDLSDLHSVYTAAEKLKSRLFAINVLINNAGGMYPMRKLSHDGFEMTFAVNHLGHFALTMHLMPLLQKGQARIINISSEAHKMGKPDFDDLNSEKSYSSMRVYGAAKLFNIYFTKSLAEKYRDKGITAFALHPGVVNTAFGAGAGGMTGFFLTIARPFMITPEQGAQTTIYLATESGLHTKSGTYFKKKKLAKVSSAADDAAARERLWQVSEEILMAHPAGL
ncbi:SDR family oxidoreductase [Mucilaginibacter limnophilus]|uniref:SDR family oxidoreductase n=1 Tax=Mucilaginibacter limnophilus TaxID=1932778 RepID=A0A3S2V7U3_9SPHI|nr:SDR family oxidoreductase [Mucilaginibacter limnophilus]RVU00657.1 SDR family oxidoreductase [Mucilaginibacter limnophilus]